MPFDTYAGFDPAIKAVDDAAYPEIPAWRRMRDGFQQPIPGADPTAVWTAAAQIFGLFQKH